jgi:hypothetical protein
MSVMGQNLRLPQRNIGIRFTPVSRHYAHKMAAVSARLASLRVSRRTAGILFVFCLVAGYLFTGWLSGVTCAPRQL